MTKKNLSFRYILLATLLGNTLEWFEYLTFAFLAPIFSKVFFPHLDAWRALTHTMIGFLFGYLLRPFGGLLFGFIGDRYGRKTALISSILLMSFPTLAIGLLPTYDQVGWAAIGLLLAMRMAQGLATGGEFPSSMTFIVESAPPCSRSFFGSFAYVGMICGVILGGLDYFILNHFFHDSLYTWGWRIAYYFGGVFGLVAFFVRAKLHETHPFQHLKECHEILPHPLSVLAQKHSGTITRTIGIQLLQAVSFNLFIPFSITYFSQILHVEESKASALNLVFLLVLLIALPSGGLLAHRIGRKKLMIGAAWGHFFFALPIYWMLQAPAYRPFALIAIGLLLGLLMGPSVALVCSLFPTTVRLSGVSLGFNLTVALGASSLILSLFLIHRTGLAFAPAFVIMASALVTLFSLWKLEDPP